MRIQLVKHKFIVYFIFIFLLITIPSSFFCIDIAIGDGEYYWNTGTLSIITENGIDFNNYPYSFRGYFLPFAYLALKTIGELFLLNPYMLLIISNSIFLTLTITVFLPKIFGIKQNDKQYYIAGIIEAILLLIFWMDLIVHPLSDLQAMLFLIASVYFAKMCLQDNILGDKYFKVKKIFFSLLSGSFLYIAYNIRAVYFYSAILLVVYLIVNIIKSAFSFASFKKIAVKFTKKHIIDLATILLSFTVGAAIFALPQSLINYSHTGNFLPRITTERYTELYSPDLTGSLQEQQVFWGITMPRYETYFGGDATVYESAAVRFRNQTAQYIMEHQGVTEENFNYKTLIVLFLMYPLDFIAIYSQHAISVITPMFDSIYIYDLNQNKYFIILLNMLLWFVGLLVYISKSERTEDSTFFKKNGYIIITLIFSCALTLAGAIEPRFFIILHFLLYFYVASVTDIRLLFSFLKKYWFKVILLGALLFVFWISATSFLLSSVEYGTLLMS